MAPPKTLNLERLIDAHQRGVWRYLRFLGATETQADDLTQETFLEVWRRPFEELSEHATASYLRLVAKNRFLMLLRVSRRRAEVDVEQAEAVFAAFAGEDGGDAKVEALRDCLTRLEGRGRELVELFYTRELSREETARALGMTEDGVKTLLRRTRDALRACVERKLKHDP